MTDDPLLDQVNQLVNPLGCIATDLADHAVNVMGDSRTYLPAVYVKFPVGMNWDEIARISTLVTNRTRVSRVLMEIVNVRDERIHLIQLLRYRAK